MFRCAGSVCSLFTSNSIISIFSRTIFRGKDTKTHPDKLTREYIKHWVAAPQCQDVNKKNKKYQNALDHGLRQHAQRGAQHTHRRLTTLAVVCLSIMPTERIY